MLRLMTGRTMKHSSKEMQKPGIKEEEEADLQIEAEEISNSSSPVEPHLTRSQESLLHAKPKTGSMR